jgi:hypothetical protein
VSISSNREPVSCCSLGNGIAEVLAAIFETISFAEPLAARAACHGRHCGMPVYL